MEHIGIDLGSRKSHLCIRTEKNETVEERVVRTSELGAWLAGRHASRVILETCCEAFTVADMAQATGHEVTVVPAAVVRQLGVGYRGVKNDVRDAQVLSRSSVALGSSLPAVHVPSAESRTRQRYLVQRGNLVRARTALVNGIKSQLRSLLLKLPSGSIPTLPRRTRAFLTNANESELLAVLEPTLQALETIQASIRTLEKELKKASAADASLNRLKSMPGVGTLTATAFAAAIDDLSRFSEASRVASYFGLTPGEHTTGGKKRLTRTTRAGKSHVRTLLIQAAWTHVRVCSASPLSRLFARIAETRPKQVAIVAVARKLAIVLFTMMRDQTCYRLPCDETPSEAVQAVTASLQHTP